MHPSDGQADQDRPLWDLYDVALLDLDGVVYVGDDAVGHAGRALAQARGRGMRLAFVTNNASRPPAAVAEHLASLGVPAHAEEVVTSAQAAARVVAEQVPPGSAVLVVGGPGLEAALREQGLVPVRSATESPAAVAQGYHPDVGWRDLAEGAYALAAGVPWVASNTDLTIPTPRGPAPGNGTLVGVLRAATGREPVVAGKPEPPMHREAMIRTRSRRPLVVGDRLDTDVEGATRAGVDSLLVLTGVTTSVDLVRAPPPRRPTFVSEDLRGLARAARGLGVAAGADRRGSWTASVESGRLRLEQAGDEASGGDEAGRDPLDALRAACGAMWAEIDPGAVDGVADALARAGY
ncbi:MAG TPA: HAD-IIA family hydrolase [Jiangellales bacterium]|nr:HAD-IIA family hydrolase [Jiangellales bacterium]